jgi:hypothetical protein
MSEQRSNSTRRAFISRSAGLHSPVLSIDKSKINEFSHFQRTFTAYIHNR